MQRQRRDIIDGRGETMRIQPAWAAIIVTAFLALAGGTCNLTEWYFDQDTISRSEVEAMIAQASARHDEDVADVAEDVATERRRVDQALSDINEVNVSIASINTHIATLTTDLSEIKALLTSWQQWAFQQGQIPP